jgi:Protein of unknown function (DUF1822)
MLQDFDFEPILGEMIELNAAAVARSLNLSQSIDAQHRWQSYLVMLAFEGFVTLAQQRSLPFAWNRQRATLLQPEVIDTPAAINHFYMNQFHVCVIVTDSDVEDRIELPISAVDGGQMAHFYVAIAVYEELQQISLHSFLRCDRLAEYRSQHNLTATSSTYEIPASLFETDFDRLLLYLTGLEPRMLALPAATSTTFRLKQWLIQSAVQARTWVDQVADDLAWTLFAPDLSLSEMRSTVTNENLPAILTEIQRNGISIPANAQAGYQDLVVGEQAFRLYAIIWAIETTPEPEWSLLAIIESASNFTDNNGMRITINEREILVIEKTSTPGSAYLIAQILGTWDEQFTISIEVATGSITLPPFSFE